MNISAINSGQRRHNTEAEEGGSKGKGPKNSADYKSINTNRVSACKYSLPYLSVVSTYAYSPHSMVKRIW
jgi:hypothetical protein